MKAVELHVAYVWDCDECGRETFCRAIVAELSEQDREEMRERYGMDDEDLADGNWMTRPKHVTCSHCRSVFETTETEGPTKTGLGGHVE